MLIYYKNANIYQRHGIEVLHGVNFEVDEGEMVYIIGRVGSGKSTLLKTIYCDLDIDEADEAKVLEYDLLTIRRKQIPDLRREVGVVFQDFQLLGDRTVYKNLDFVLKATGWRDKERRDDRIIEVLTMVGLEDKADKMPNELSGGEQQRVAIARSILNRPEIIIADEPTGNLDPETADNIVALLKDITATGTAVVMTTHNLPMLDKYPGIVYQCGEGKIEDITAQYRQFQQEEE